MHDSLTGTGCLAPSRRAVGPGPGWLALTVILMLGLGAAQADDDGDDTDDPPRGHYELPQEGDVVGERYRDVVEEGETLIDIGQEHGIGYEEIRRANPDVSLWAPDVGTEVEIPAQHILPPVEREGIVINVAELRLYYYPEVEEGETPRVETYPIGIGRDGYDTPLGVTETKMRLKDPAWYPPESIREEAAERGDPPPEVVPPGPDNPLGDRAILLDIPGYLIHSTNQPDGIGMRASRGCIRMFPEDIESVFDRIPDGTRVNIIDQPIKAGWQDGTPYVQAYQALEEQDEAMLSLVEALALLDSSDAGEPRSLDYEQIREVVQAAGGEVVAIRPAPEPEPEEEEKDRGLYDAIGLADGFLDAVDT